jgi:hypothetical protein
MLLEEFELKKETDNEMNIYPSDCTTTYIYMKS